METLPRLILASASPRRRDLLTGLGVVFTVRPVDIDETPRPMEAPERYVRRVAEEKAAARVKPGELVLAADTAVVLDGEILGKPRDVEDAQAMLGRLEGREHTVLTGVVLRTAGDGSSASAGRGAATVAASQVRIAPMSRAEIEWYVATGETMDKAGSYAAQGLGAMFVEEIRGDYTNVVGLPLPTTYRLFGEMGFDLRAFRG